MYPGSGARWPVHLHNFFSSLTRPDTIVFMACLFYLWNKRKAFEDQRNSRQRIAGLDDL